VYIIYNIIIYNIILLTGSTPPTPSVTVVRSVRLSVMPVNDCYDSTKTRLEVAYDLSNAAVIDDLD